MTKAATSLADLHLHLYGAIRHSRFLQYIRDREVDWTAYRAGFQAAYGVSPPIEDVLAQCRSGDPDAIHEFRRLFVFSDDDGGSFTRFGAKFNLLNVGSEYMDLLASNEVSQALRDEVQFFVQGMVADLRLEGIGYAELRLGVDLKDQPSIPAATAREVFELLLELCAEADQPGFQPRLAVSLPRGNPWFYWDLTKELALGRYGHLVTGIDFCHIEEGHPPKEKEAFFSAVYDFNERHPERALAILYHVGESFQDKSLESAVRWVQEAAELGAHRLGHAIALGVDPRLYGEHVRTETVAERRDHLAYDLRHAEGLEHHGVNVDVSAVERETSRLTDYAPDDVVTHHYDGARLEELRRRQEYALEGVRQTGAVIEVCPTSNRRIGGIADPTLHPVHRFLAHDLPFIVGSDDPGIFDITLQNEIDWVVRAAGLPRTMERELGERSWRYRSEVMSGREKK